MVDRGAFIRGVRGSIGINLIVAAFGVLFGVGAVQSRVPGWLAVAMCVVILSGAAQFAMVTLFAAAAGPAAMLIAATGLAMRHVPMGAAINRLLPEGTRTRRKLALAYVLTDETFGLTLRAADSGEKRIADFMLGANLTLFVCWTGGTVLGVLLGSAVDLTAIGAGVLFPLLFLGLARGHASGRRDLVVAGLAVVTSIVAIEVLPSSWRITGAAFAAAAVGATLGDGEP